MTHYTPLRDHHTPNGRVHLSSQVVRLDTGHRIYHRPRHRTWDWWAADILFRFVLPVLVLLFAALAWIGFIWLVLAVGRASRSLGGGGF